MRFLTSMPRPASLAVAEPSAGRARLTDAATAVAAGGALTLAFPHFDLAAAAWVAPAPVLLLALWRPPRQAFAWGWLAGSVFFVLLLRWMELTFRVYSAIPWPVTWLPELALAGYCGLYVGAVAWAASWIARRRSPAWALLAAPFLWVAGEWIRGHLFGGFPWGNLGYSQYRQLAVIQVAELGGVWAVSFLLLAASAALAGLVALPWRRGLVGLGLAAALVAGSVGFGAARLAAPGEPATATVAVMQPSIEQPLKWDPSSTEATLRIYEELTRQAASGRPDLVVWPETASPTVFRRDPGLQATLDQVAQAFGVALLVGSIDVADEDRGPPRLRNTAFLVTRDGLVNRYDKIHLVPFGEYVPLPGVLGFVRGWAEFISELEPGSRTVVFRGPPAPFSVVICYEGIFPELVRRFVVAGARLVVNMTNDAWFGRTSGPLQHLAMYPFRAVEHRTAVVRAANTGVSAFIAPTGEIVRALPLFERGTATERVPLRAVTTLYTRLGDWLAYLALAVSGAALALAAGGRRR